MSKCGIPSEAVVQEFDVFEQAEAGFLSGFVLFVMNQFLLQGGEEGFHCRIVPLVFFAAHRTRDAVLGEQSLVVLAGVLHSAVRVGHEVGTGTLSMDRHRQGVDHEATIDLLRHRLSDDLPREQIFDRRQIQPAVVRGEIGDVGGPDSILLGPCEAAVRAVLSHGMRMIRVRGRDTEPFLKEIVKRR